MLNPLPANSASDVSAAKNSVKSPTTVVYFDHTAALGGGEISLLNLVQQIDTARYTPIVVLGADGPLGDKLRACGIETHILPLDAKIAHTRKGSLESTSALSKRDLLTALGYAHRLSGFLREHGAEILHTNSLKADILGGLAGRLAGIPVIWHVRDRIADDYLPPSATKIFRWLCRVLPHYIAVNSRATLDALHLPPSKRARVIYNGIDASRVHVVHEGVASEGFEISDAEKATIANEAPLIGLVGRISPWKGQHIFLRAAAMVRREFPTARFQIIGSALFGEAKYETEIRALTRELELEDAVEFTGFRSDIPQLVSALDILVHASTTGEPFGQVVIEGMAAGKPVVATDGGGIPEIVLDHQTGLLVPMSDAPSMARAICWLLQHPERAAQMGNAGRERVRDHFTIGQTAQNVQALYAHIEDNHGDRRRVTRLKTLAFLSLSGVCLGIFVRYILPRIAKIPRSR